jgi:hypothetical protein
MCFLFLFQWNDNRLFRFSHRLTEIAPPYYQELKYGHRYPKQRYRHWLTRRYWSEIAIPSLRGWWRQSKDLARFPG